MGQARRCTFLHLRLHGKRLRWVLEVAGREAEDEVASAVCPHCEAIYVSYPLAGADGREIEGLERTAEARLRGECPDHAHIFAVR